MAFKFDEDAVRKAAEELVQQHQRRFNDELQRVVREVRDEMNGQPADDVYGELVGRLTAEFGDSFEPNHESLRKIAAAIEERDLTD